MYLLSTKYLVKKMMLLWNPQNLDLDSNVRKIRRRGNVKLFLISRYYTRSSGLGPHSPNPTSFSMYCIPHKQQFPGFLHFLIKRKMNQCWLLGNSIFNDRRSSGRRFTFVIILYRNSIENATSYNIIWRFRGIYTLKNQLI